VICWKDFILDNDIGPCLELFGKIKCEVKKNKAIQKEIKIKVCDTQSPDKQNPSVMEDAGVCNNAKTQESVKIQETRRIQRPARKAGHTELESVNPGKDAKGGSRENVPRRGDV